MADSQMPEASVLPVHAGHRTPASPDVLRLLGRLARKELRESLRDRRTVATLILMPLIVYPLLGTVIQKFAISRIDTAATAALVALDETLPPEVLSLFADTGSGPAQDSGTANGGLPNGQTPAADGASVSPPPSPSAELEGLARQLTTGANPMGAENIRLEVRLNPAGSDARQLVAERTADVAVHEKPSGVNPSTGRPEIREFQIFCRIGDPFSLKAAQEVERRIVRLRDRFVRRLLIQLQVDPQVMPRVSKYEVETPGPKESPLSAFVPLMLVLMTMTGAVYPAIDLTAGERERGTLEMLIAAPVSKPALLTGKFAAVFTVAVLTAVVNLTAMILTLYGTGFDKVLLGDGVTLVMFLQVLTLLVVFASFFSAVLLGITSFARSFREAQAWLIPLMLISLAPGILSLIPGIRLTIPLAFVPLVNIVLLGKELFQGISRLHLFVITLLATAAYAVVALRIAARVFGSDAVLFAGESANPRRGKPGDLREHVPTATGIGYLVLLAPAFVVLSGLRGKFVAPENLPGQAVLSGLLTLILFGILPYVVTVTGQVRRVSAFALRGFHPAALPGAILLGLTLWSLTYEVLLLGKGSLGWARLLDNPQLRELAEKLTAETPLLLRLISFAAIPAICEELFFRGFLMSALNSSERKSWMAPWLISSVVFALFHVIVDQMLTLERFPATFLLGLVLGWLRLSTGSIFPGIVMHAVSNGLLLTLQDLNPLLMRIGLNLNVEDQSHLPGWFLGGAVAVAILGAAFVRLGARQSTKNSGISAGKMNHLM